jgi:hypothetical protein
MVSIIYRLSPQVAKTNDVRFEETTSKLFYIVAFCSVFCPAIVLAVNQSEYRRRFPSAIVPCRSHFLDVAVEYEMFQAIQITAIFQFSFPHGLPLMKLTAISPPVPYI